MNKNYLDVNDEYLIKVIKQFESATGESVTGIPFEVYLNAFSQWIKSRQRIKSTYKFLLKNLFVNYDDEYVAEIGKGRYDTLVASYEKTSVITPYVRGIKSKGVTVFSGFKVLENGVILCDSLYDFSTFMIQNPYSIEDIKNFETIEKSLVVGIYGNTFDRDKKEKIKMLYDLGNKLETGFIIDGGTVDDKYCYSLVKSNNRKR